MKLTPPSMDRDTMPNYLSALVMAVIVVMLFTPFWHFGEGEAAQAVSINSYVWFPSDNTQVESYFQEALGEKPDINSVIVAPILLLVFGVLGALVCIMKADQPFAAIFPAFAPCGARRNGWLCLGNGSWWSASSALQEFNSRP